MQLSYYIGATSPDISGAYNIFCSEIRTTTKEGTYLRFTDLRDATELDRLF